MTPITLNPRMAWFSGYRIPYETWCQWTSTLPIPPAPYQEPSGGKPNTDSTNRSRFYYLMRYVEWKDSLRRKNRRMMPRPRFEEDGDTTVSVFFPVRWIEYFCEEQVKPGDEDYDKNIGEEKESDRAQFQKFLKFVEARGMPLDEGKASFGWKKDMDPHDDWRAY